MHGTVFIDKHKLKLNHISCFGSSWNALLCKKWSVIIINVINLGMSVGVMQAGVLCTSFLLATQLETGNWRKLKNHDPASELRHLGIN